MTEPGSIGFYGGGGSSTGSYIDENGDTVQVTPSTPLPVTIAGGITVELGDDAALSIDGSTVLLAAGTKVGLDAGTTIALDQATIDALVGYGEVSLVDGTVVGIDGPVTLAAGAVVGLVPGTEIALADGTTVAIDDTTPINVAIGDPIEVTFDAATVGLTANGFTVDDAHPLPVEIIGGASTPVGDIVSTADGDAQVVKTATGSKTAIEGTVSLAAGQTIHVDNPTSGSLTVHVDNTTITTDAASQTSLRVANNPVANGNPLPVAVISGGGSGSSGDIVTTPDGDAQLVKVTNYADFPSGGGGSAGSIITGDTGQSSQLVSGARKEQTFSVTATGTVATIDVSNYRTVSIQVASVGVGATFSISACNDNTTFQPISVVNVATGAMTSSITATGLYYVPTNWRWFRLGLTAITSGTATGTIELLSDPTTVPVSITIPSTVDTELSSAATQSDAAGSPNTSSVYAAGQVFNGSTWDRQRSANTADGGNGTGVQAAGILGWDGSVYRRVKTDNTGALVTASSGGGGTAGTTITGSSATATGQFPIPSTDVSSYSVLSITVSATAGVTFELQGSEDNTNWVVLPVYTVGASPMVWATSFGATQGTTVNASVSTRYARLRVAGWGWGSTVPYMTMLPNATPLATAVINPTGTPLSVSLSNTSANSAEGGAASALLGTGVLGFDGSAYRRLKTDTSGVLVTSAGVPAGLVVTGSAQTVVGNNPIPSTDVSGYASLTISFSAAANQQYELLGSNDNTNWYAIPYIWPHAPSGNYQFTNSVPIGPQLGVVVAAPIYTRYVRLRLSNYVNGSVVPTMTLFPSAQVPIAQVVNPPGQNIGVDTELPAAAALADNFANPTAPTVGSALSAFDGTNWSRVRTSAGATGTTGQGVLGVGTLGYNATLNQYLRTPATSTGALHVATQGSTAFAAGKATVATAGTPVQLAANACSSVTVKSTATNTGLVYVGNSSANALAANGFDLSPGETLTVDVTNTNLIYVNAASNGSTVSYVWVA